MEFAVLVLICCSLACLALSESCTVDGVGSLAVGADDDCGSYKDHYGADSQDASDYLWGKSLIRSGIDELCQNSKLFCFPSTLYGLIPEEHNSQTINLDVNRDGVEVVLSGIGNGNSSWSEDSGLFELSNGRTLSCSLHSGEVIHGSPDQEFTSSCDGPLLCENEGRFNLKNAEMKLPQPLDGSYPCVQISHYQLNWGQSNLYHPSATSLSIKNTCNEFALNVYESFSTDSQFYPCNFSEVQLGPGEAVSLCLVFLPTKLGLSTAQFIVQTSSGGFLVRANGFGVASPYRIMPMEEFDASSSGWKKSVSLFNPFDEAIELEEMIAWVSVSVGNSSLLAKAICREEEGHHASSGPGFLNAKKWLDVRTGFGFPTLTLRPLSNWLIGPHGTGGIMDIAFQPNFDGKILGTICLQLRRTLLNKTETLLVPLEGELYRKPTYDLVTASIEASGIYKATRSVVFSVSVTNSGSELLKIVKITEISENRKFLQIKYSEGLLLFPGSLTQVAVVMAQPLNVEYDNPCKICILTNSSFMPQLEIPCQNFSHLCLRQSLESYFDHQLHENVNIDDVRIGPLGPSRMSSSATKILSKAEADEYVLKNWRNQGTRGDLTVIDEHRVVFPVVPVGSHLSKFITVKNPSPEPVAVQLIMNSGEIVDNCSIPDGNLQPFSSFYVLHDSDRPIGHGFSIGENAVKEAFIHPYGSVALGPIFFRPSNQCEWRSSVLVRNNISGVESLSLLGFGGSLSLLLREGSELSRKIDFDLNLSVPLNISPPNTVLNPEDAFCGCHKPVLKDLLVTNGGDLPISITGIRVSGAECQMDGFQVHNCKGFSLEPGESTKLQVSYQTDFTSSLVERDLELILASSRLVIPMKATVPVFMLNSCRNSLFSFQVKKGSIASFMAVSLMFGFMCFLLYHGMTPGSLDGSTDTEKSSKPIVKDTAKSSCMDHSRNGKVVLESKPEFLLIGSSISQDGQFKDPNSASESVAVENSAEVVQTPTRNGKPETSETVNLTVRTKKDKARRRKKRKGAGLMGFAEGASSHSSASTPSSPLSPALPLTPKQVPTQSLVKEEPAPASSPISCSKSPEIRSGPKRKTFEAEVSVKGSSSGPRQAEPPKGRLLQSATFPSMSSTSSPNVRCNSLTPTSTSGIALHARAPGSKLHKQAQEAQKETGISDKFRYDIWGNHLERIHLAGEANGTRSFVEKDFVSFFMEEPQTLVSNSGCRSVSCSDQGG